MSPAAVRRTAHASGLHSVERELAALHREVLHLGREDARTVRLSVLNLIALCADGPGAALAEATVEHLSRTHPARAIIVLADPAVEDAIEADLALVCSPGVDGQICAEQVRLTLGGRPALHLSSAVAPLLIPDIPVYLWLLEAGSLEQTFGHEVSALDARLIIDSDGYGDALRTVAALDAELRLHPALALEDVSWARGRRWREQIAQAFDEMKVRPFVRRVNRVEIECHGGEPSAIAWLTAGWLLSRLPATGGSPPQVKVSESNPDGGAPGMSAVRLFASSEAHRATISVVLAAGHMHTRVHIDGGLVSARALPLAEPEVSHLVGSLLEDSVDDPAYREAVEWAARLAATQGSAASGAVDGSGPR